MRLGIQLPAPFPEGLQGIVNLSGEHHLAVNPADFRRAAFIGYPFQFQRIEVLVQAVYIADFRVPRVVAVATGRIGNRSPDPLYTDWHGKVLALGVFV